jgi:hypothetical protein
MMLDIKPLRNFAHTQEVGYRDLWLPVPERAVLQSVATLPLASGCGEATCAWRPVLALALFDSARR